MTDEDMREAYEEIYSDADDVADVLGAIIGEAVTRG
jgi:hypothetical protein